MPNQSQKTKTITFRLPVEAVKILERRVKRGKGRWESVNHYLKDRIVYDAKRAR